MKKATAGYIVLTGIVSAVAFLANIKTISEWLFPDPASPKVSIENSVVDTSPVIVDSPGASVSIAKIDENKVRSLTLEAKLKVTKKPGSELPPEEVPHQLLITNRASVTFEGHEINLDLQSPISFKRNEDDSVAIINQYSLSAGSPLEGLPFESLGAIDQLIVPINTIVYSKSFSKMTELTISIKINGKDTYSQVWPYDAELESEPTFTIPLDESWYQPLR